MALEKAKLDNGLTVYNDQIPGEHTNGVTMFVPYGSVDESIGDEGVAHVFEHSVHLRTDEFENRSALRRHAKLSGMQTNANTFFTRTLYYANGIGLEPNIRHLSQILQHTHFPEDMVAHEMKAVRREAVTKLDNINQQHDIAATYAMFGAPYGRRVLGYHDRLDFDADRLKRLHEQYYKLGRMSLIVSGRASLDEVAGLANRYFEADTQPYDTANNARLSATLGEHHLTGLVREDSQSVRINVSYPLSSEFREAYNQKRTVYNVAALAIREATFEALRYDKGIAYEGGAAINSYNHPNAWDIEGYVVTDKEHVQTAREVFTDIFSRTSHHYSDDELQGSRAMYQYAVSRVPSSIEKLVDAHVGRLETYREPEDVSKIIDTLETMTLSDVRTTIDEIVAFTSSSQPYTHLTGKRNAIGDVEQIIDRSEIA